MLFILLVMSGSPSRGSFVSLVAKAMLLEVVVPAFFIPVRGMDIKVSPTWDIILLNGLGCLLLTRQDAAFKCATLCKLASPVPAILGNTMGSQQSCAAIA